MLRVFLILRFADANDSANRYNESLPIGWLVGIYECCPETAADEAEVGVKAFIKQHIAFKLLGPTFVQAVALSEPAGFRHSDLEQFIQKPPFFFPEPNY